MALKKRGLGRGLDALLGGGARIPPTPREGSVRHLSLERIRPNPHQPRDAIAEENLESLAASIRSQGVIQPVVVRPVKGGEDYELIAGERRWRAAQKAGFKEIPALIKDVSDEVALALALVENIQREDLNPLEEARAMMRLGERFALTHQQIAEAVGRSREAVSNLMRLLDLPPEVQALIEKGRLHMGHARALLGVKSPERQKALAQKVAELGLSVRETERLVRRRSTGKTQPSAPDPDIQRLQERLSQRLGAKVKLHCSPKGRGKVVIHYNSLEELDGILSHIQPHD
ncbi:MAG: ParB/RepB/Spo0J family partition protein [Gammaproteobacteria bacterium]|nr:MAG: ParB/RepB/Spo0J family partition protein [Gammaproteobacteria bacterium]